MEIIKRKILLENLISRKPDGTYGAITGDSIYFKIILTQNGDDMGLFNSFDNTQYPLTGGTEFDFDNGKLENLRYVNDDIDIYRTNARQLSGYTEDRLDDVKNYDENDLYRIGFDIKREDYTNYTGASINGRTRVTSFTSASTEYVTDANDDGDIGTINQNDGFLLKSYSGQTRTVNINGINRRTPLTEIFYKGQGWNETNVGHSGLTKEDYLFGITSEPQVFSDVFIERGVVSPKEKHLKLSEAKNLNDLINYGNGFFNVKKYGK